MPFGGGAVLTLSYDLGRRLERLPSVARHDHRAPDLHAAIYRGVYAIDHRAGTVGWVGEGSPEPGWEELWEAGWECGVARGRLGVASVSVEGYRAAVQTAREWIARGDLFEVNLSRRHEVEGVEPDALFAGLERWAPAPFMADLELGGGRRLLSASPERFVRLDAGGRLETWPIKGTRPRGDTPEADRRAAAELVASAKDQAELAMIVDLARNDLGRVATPGTVRVTEPRRVQTWPTVHHTVAVVEAELEAGRSWVDVVRAGFPPGSVTGAPKIRACEVIEALEPVRRGLYCGAFGYVGFDGAMDLAVAIRIAAVEGSRAWVHGGGAVVLDSDPAEEEREAAAKVRALLRAAQGEECVGG